MIVAFDSLPNNSRLWVYQANTPLNQEQITAVRQTMENFLSTWAAHGNPLRAGYDIRYGQFIILAVDESLHGASGCSIDGSVALVRELEEVLGLSLLDRSQVAVETGEGIRLFPFNEIKRRISAGEIAPSDDVFNNAVATMEAFQEGWKVPAEQSWLKRHFASVA